MKLWLALQVLSVCSIVLVVSHDESDGTVNANNLDLESTFLTRVKRHGAKNECSGRLFESVTNCCDIPMLLPLSAMQNCSGGFIQNDRQVVHMLGMPYCSKPNIMKNKKTPSANATVPDTSAIMLSNYKNNTGGRLCVFECLFKGQGLAGTSNDGFDVALVTTKYMAVVSPAWKESVKAAITSCAAVVKGLNLAAVTPPDGGKKCNPGAALFLSCIYKYNLENCPAAVTFTGASCKDDLQKLKTSDVFACLRSGA